MEIAELTPDQIRAVRRKLDAMDRSMPPKIEIERRTTSDGFDVRVGEFYDAGGMNSEEALGCVVEFLYLGRAHPGYLKTAETWGARETLRQEIRERNQQPVGDVVDTDDF